MGGDDLSLLLYTHSVDLRWLGGALQCWDARRRSHPETVCKLRKTLGIFVTGISPNHISSQEPVKLLEFAPPAPGRKRPRWPLLRMPKSETTSISTDFSETLSLFPVLSLDIRSGSGRTVARLPRWQGRPRDAAYHDPAVNAAGFTDRSPLERWRPPFQEPSRRRSCHPALAPSREVLESRACPAVISGTLATQRLARA